MMLVLLLLAPAAAIVERSTGYDFPPKMPKLGKLQRLGVRKKGPIKVYAVGMYEDASKAKSFMLKMCMGLNPVKMTESLVGAIKPRLTSDESSLDAFSDLMLNALPDGCKRDMCLVFGTGGGKLSVTIDDKNMGVVPSSSLANAFVGVYCDEKAVCKLKEVTGTAA